jgi:hypothetical protein
MCCGCSFYTVPEFGNRNCSHFKAIVGAVS